MPALDRKRRVTAFVVAMAVLIATPLAVVASDTFTDVPDSNIFHDDINWLADSGVTRGCNPPANDEFCPSDNVTRGQMAAFIRRLSENQVVDAATAIEAEHAASADTASNADNADTLAGRDPSAYRTVVFGGGSSGGVDHSDEAVASATTSVDTSGHAVVSYSFFVAVSSDGLSDMRSWLQLEDPDCANESEIPGSFSVATASVNEPAFNAVAASTIVALSAGTHTVTLCVEGDAEAAVGDPTVTGVFSPTGSGAVDVASAGASARGTRR